MRYYPPAEKEKGLIERLYDVGKELPLGIKLGLTGIAAAGLIALGSILSRPEKIIQPTQPPIVIERVIVQQPPEIVEKIVVQTPLPLPIPTDTPKSTYTPTQVSPKATPTASPTMRPTEISNPTSVPTATDTSTPISVKTKMEYVGSYNLSSNAIGTPYVINNYAYVGHDSGLLIFDVSDPTKPKKVGSYNTEGLAAPITILDHYAYVAENRDGLWLHRVDISDPVSPKTTGAMHIPGRYDATEVYNLNSQTYAIVTAWHSALRIFDISDISNPKEIGTYPISGDVFGIDVSYPYAYVANWESGLRVLNISDPTNLREVGRYRIPGWASHVHITDRYAFVSCSDCEDGSLQILDISEPTRLKKVSHYPSPSRGKHIFVSHPYAYISDWDKGLRAIDVSIPSKPRLVGYYDSPRGIGQKGESGIYGVYAVDSDVYLSTDSGLLILRVPQ